jgi:phosphoribosyl 1,2-cyclic phosphodiesterase
MPLRFCSLGSGSSGNGLVVERGRTRLLLDCGFTIAETTARLARAGLAPSDLAGIVVTHEHDDHLGGVARFARRHAIAVFLTRGTALGLPMDFPASLVRLIDPHTPFPWATSRSIPFPCPTTRGNPRNTCSPTAPRASPS